MNSFFSVYFESRRKALVYFKRTIYSTSYMRSFDSLCYWLQTAGKLDNIYNKLF